MGLLKERERAARQRVEALQAELREAEAAWERFAIARSSTPNLFSPADLACSGAAARMRPRDTAPSGPVLFGVVVSGRWGLAA